MHVVVSKLGLALWLAGCGGFYPYNGAGTAACDTAAGCPSTGDADTDTDTDTDTDADTDADTNLEDCTDGVDNNGNGLRDCDDPACLSVCDEDNDGHTADQDCDDDDDAIYPGADELCDAIDNDCDGADDEDNDGDGSAVCDDCDDTDAGRYPGANESCDGVDSDCDGNDGPMWTWDFEVGPPLAAPFGTSGDANWGVNVTQPHGGSYSGNSGNVADNQKSNLLLDVTMCEAGTVSFWHSTSSEANFDYLRFSIDGVQADEWSGIQGYSFDSYNLSVGDHTLEWRYAKDGSLSNGTDNAWVDDIEVVGGEP